MRGAAEDTRGHVAVHSVLLAFISVHIRQERCLPHLVCNFRKGCAFQDTKAVYYYSMEVISAAMRPHAKNNAPNMAWITHGQPCAHALRLPLGNGLVRTLQGFGPLISIIAVNVRTCLCLCNCLVCTPMPRVVCINCGWMGLKGQFIKTGGGSQKQTREWKLGEFVPSTHRL